MLIKRIKAKNFKTYLNLDLDISVEQDRPIILVGGANGGGKTTLFDAIYGALYGLQIKTAKQFNELLNAGATATEEKKIVLELHFSGMVLHEEQQYVLSRTYILNNEKQPVEAVKLNMSGNVFSYGTATPPPQRAEQEAQINKIIKANLPQELSRYFLFDAMDAGNLLKEDKLNQVIKENIENVMGFNKYLAMAKASENLYQEQTAQKLKLDEEKKEYLELINQKKAKDEEMGKATEAYKDALGYSTANQQLYEDLKSGKVKEATLKQKMEQLQAQIDNIYQKEKNYLQSLDEAAKEIEIYVSLPKLAETIRSEILLILKSKEQLQQEQNTSISATQVESVSKSVLAYLDKQKIDISKIELESVVDYVIAAASQSGGRDAYSFLEFSEVKALENLLNQKAKNPFPALSQQQVEMEISLKQIPQLQQQIETLRSQILGQDYNILKAYEDNEKKIKEQEAFIVQLKSEIEKIAAKIHQYDIQGSQEPDPKYDTLARLKPFFEDVANSLLKVKKQQIELMMKQDLNTNLAAYRDVIDRVELSENLEDLTFKIFHTAGNELYLNQLNTASKQVVIQVLLKSLHEFGDYDPPVMIDTVMGVLDETSRATVLENYFPALSQQTILLSSDSEIRTGKDLDKIAPFISKAYTLRRDRQMQCTSVDNGYFNTAIND